MKRTCIGVHVHAEPENLLATLASVEAHTPGPFELVLLPDGPDAPTAEGLARLGRLPQLGTAEPRGAPACFNRLVASGQEPVVVLLESGCRVGPGWLDALLAALDADPRNGLAGPSTNRSWNEQGVFRAAGGSPDEVARTAAEARRRFGRETRLLAPLYSLADFCYAVRREVFDAVGPADEGYGLGPCWEMDYNVRAARAGFRGVWACGAYVYRAPVTARRQREEAARFEASKRLYQDKFCGQRLRGVKADYRPHCRGDDCPHFAPTGLIALGGVQTPADRPAPTAASSAAPVAVAGESLPPGDSRPPARQDGPPARPEADHPLVSCIMPTRDRRAVVPLAVRGFLAQDWPALELVVVDDGADPVADLLPDDPRIRYLRLPSVRTVGAKRNAACAAARGEFVAHWDDDDWYPAGRVRAQVAALLDRKADACGSSRVHFYDPAADRAWLYAYPPGGAAWVTGTTLVYRKSLWARNPFPEIQVGEDTRFLWSPAPKAVLDLTDPGLCVAMVHAGNVSPKAVTGPWWQPVPAARVRELLGPLADEYRAALGGGHGRPRVSCIMPTRDRRPFLPLALRCFADQDYPDRELVVVDDGADPVADLVDGVPGVRYVRLPTPRSIGAKRNVACEAATGAVITHWDDDDWYAPDRLTRQVAPLLAGTADTTGLEGRYFLELPGLACWAPSAELHRRLFFADVHGGTMTYWKELLKGGVRYPDVSLAEDAVVLRDFLARGRRVVRVANGGSFVYTRHSRNAWQFAAGRFLDPAGWERVALPPTMPPEAAAEYAAAAGQLGGAARPPRV